MGYMDDIKISNKRYNERVKRDIIGMIYSSDLAATLRADETVGVMEGWQKVEDYLKENIEEKKAHPVYDLVSEYGSEMEEMGFKTGFHIATKILMEGLSGAIF